MLKPSQAQIDAAAEAIREFDFGNYGLDDVDALLVDEPDTQEWVPVLARAVATAAVNA